MKDINILMVGNSYAQNCHTFAHDISLTTDTVIDIYVLMYPGCSFEQHVNFIKNDEHVYVLFHNGERVENNVSANEVFKRKEWDYLTMQQASGVSGVIAYSHPYFEELMSLLKERCPKSNLLLHQTWSYAPGYIREDFKRFYNNDTKIMFYRICDVYNELHNLYNLPIINSGKAIELCREKYNYHFTQEGLHLDEKGCYISGLALVLYFTKNFNLENVFVPTKKCMSDFYYLPNKEECLNYINLLMEKLY